MNQEDKIIKNKLEVLRLAEMLGNVSQTCAVVAFAIEQPAFGQVRVANELKKHGLFISPGD